MKIIDDAAAEDRPIAPPAGLKIKLALIVGWGILMFLLAMSLTVQPAQAQEMPAGQLPDSITMTRGMKNGRKALTFKVNTPHAVFRYYDRIGTSWDRSGGKCRKNRAWFDYYMADVYNDTEPIRQSHDYTFRQREEGAKVCLLVVFDDYREAQAAGYHYGPFSFDPDRNPVETVGEDENEQPVDDQQTEDQPAPKPKKPAPAEESRQPPKSPESAPEPVPVPEPKPEPKAVESANVARTAVDNQPELAPPSSQEAADRQDALPATIEETPTTDTLSAATQTEADGSGNDNGSAWIWLGAYTLAVLTIGAVLFAAISKKERRNR